MADSWRESRQKHFKLVLTRAEKEALKDKIWENVVRDKGAYETLKNKVRSL